MDCSPPGSSVHGISQARILEWVAISSSRGSSWPRDQTPISCISDSLLHCRQILYHHTMWEAQFLTVLRPKGLRTAALSRIRIHPLGSKGCPASPEACGSLTWGGPWNPRGSVRKREWVLVSGHVVRYSGCRVNAHPGPGTPGTRLASRAASSPVCVVADVWSKRQGTFLLKNKEALWGKRPLLCRASRTSSANGQPLAAEALRHEVQLCILTCLTTPSHPIFSAYLQREKPQPISLSCLNIPSYHLPVWNSEKSRVYGIKPRFSTCT